MADGNFMGCACAICASGTDSNFQLDQTGTGNNIRFVSDTGNVYLDSLIYGVAWDDPTILYSFPDSRDDYGYDDEADGFIPLTVAMQQAADFALSDWWGGDAQAGFSVAGFTGLNVDWTDNPNDNAHIRLAQTDEPAIASDGLPIETAWAYYPSTGERGGDAWFYTGVYDYTDPQAGNYAWATMIHEIGHALGLRHPHDRNPVMPSDMDHMEYTVMSYRSSEGASTGYTNEPGGYAQTWMMLDIAALQQLYGADFTPNDGDVVYSWTPGSGNTYVNGDVAIDAVDNRIFATIWDGGGNVTYDLSAYDSGVDLDLRPGQSSVFDDAQLAHLGGGNYASGNIYNALLYNDDPRSLVQNAIGSSGDDTIRGNDADNVIDGYGGNNEIHTGGGDNRVVGNDGHNTIFGGDGDNSLWGGAGNNVIYGGLGDDVIGGGPGDAYIEVSGGHNTIFGGVGNNEIHVFGDGDNRVWGGRGDGEITVYGDGDNRIGGARGDDVIDIRGSGGGADTFVFRANHDHNTITDFDTDDGDRLQLIVHNPWNPDLWSGVRTAAQVVDDFARVDSSGNTVFRFDSGDRVTLLGFDDLATLSDHILIV